MVFGNNTYMSSGRVGFGAMEPIGTVRQMKVPVSMPLELTDRVLDEATTKKEPELCPFTKKIPCLELEVDFFSEPTASYICSVNGKNAREGMIRRVQGGSETPCSLGYAKTCDIYIRKIANNTR